MKIGFVCGARVETVGEPRRYGTLVPSATGTLYFPHYQGEGFYTVRWSGIGVRIVHEDDIWLSEPGRKSP